jgi:hypothetical protein
VTEGLYDLEVPFGSALFTGPDRFLEVRVAGEILTPRLHLTSVPFALASGSVDGHEGADLEESLEITAALAAHTADPVAHHPPFVDTNCDGVDCDLKDPSLVGCDSVDTDASGNLMCGTDEVGTPIPEARSLFWPAGALGSDGTLCGEPALGTIGGGPRGYTIVCADDPAATVYGSAVMPDSWDGGPVTIEMSVASLSGAPAGDFAMQFSALCRGSGEVIDGLWGVPASAAVDFDAGGACGPASCPPDAAAQATTAALFPGGSCAGGKILFWRGRVDDGATTADAATVHLLGIKAEYTASPGGDE